MNKPIRCAVIGQNPMPFPWGFDEEDKFCSKMKTELAQQIMDATPERRISVPDRL